MTNLYGLFQEQEGARLSWIPELLSLGLVLFVVNYLKLPGVLDMVELVFLLPGLLMQINSGNFIEEFQAVVKKARHINQ